jgi:hypothetical protein
MSDHNYGAALISEMLYPINALSLEREVANREYLVYQQNLRAHMNRHRESQAHVHTGAIGAQGFIDNGSKLREFDDLFKSSTYLPACQPTYDTGDVNVLAPGKVRVETRTQIEEAADPPIHLHCSLICTKETAEKTKQSRFSGSVPSDDSKHSTVCDCEAEVT